MNSPKEQSDMNFQIVQASVTDTSDRLKSYRNTFTLMDCFRIYNAINDQLKELYNFMCENYKG